MSTAPPPSMLKHRHRHLRQPDDQRGSAPGPTTPARRTMNSRPKHHLHRRLHRHQRRRHQHHGHRAHRLSTNDAGILSTATVALTETNAPLTASGTLSVSDVDSTAAFNA
ncbi:hypothetical protein LP420_05240 [Massilia sp. B-10]|nr:hypothetical protein LP420_05240 [Massilia sp. B-10]